MSQTILLDYAGPAPSSQQRSFIARFLRAIWFALLVTIFVAVVLVRGAVLGIGYACVFAGTLLLFVGGRRSAGVTLKRWRAHWSDHLHLWIGDILRPFRRPRRVVAPLMLPS
jgi:hypothetical protein